MGYNSFDIVQIAHSMNSLDDDLFVGAGSYEWTIEKRKKFGMSGIDFCELF